MPDTVISAEQIKADFGEFYLDAGQNETNLHLLPMEEFGTQSAFTTIPTNDTIVRESSVELSEILQPYQDEFTPKGDTSFKPVSTNLHKMKIDQEFNPHKLQASWLGFLTSNKASVETWPFIRWFIEVYLMKKAKEDLEMRSVYNGVRKEPDAGVAGDAVDSMDGIEVIQDRLIASGDLTPITFGAIASSDKDFATQIETFIQGLPEKYRYLPMELNLNRTLRDKYNRGVREKYKMNYNPADIAPYSVADFDNITVVGRASMQGKNRIWLTPKYNAPFYVKGFENASAFQIEKAKRKVAVFTEWWVGLNFIQPELLFCSDGEVD